MTRPLTKQTRAILRGLKAGKPAAQIANELNIPTYTVYNAKHRHGVSVTPAKKKPAVVAPLPSEAVGRQDTFAPRNNDWTDKQAAYKPAPKQLSLWGRIKAVFTGEYA
jgi:hypothetical protein